MPEPLEKKEEKIIQAFPMPDGPDPPDPEEVLDAPETEAVEVAEPEKKEAETVVDETKETVSDEPQEYTQEEFDALPQEERDRINAEWDTWKTQNPDVADEAKAAENIKALEVELRQKIENYEKKAENADKLLTQRLQQISEAAKLNPEIQEGFKTLKEISKTDKADPNRKAVGFEEQIYYTTQNTPAQRGETPQAHYERVKAANKYMNDRENKKMLVQQDFIAEQLEPLRPIVEAMTKVKRDGESGEAWRQTFAELKEDMKLPDDENTNAILTEAIKEMGVSVLTQGISLSPDARKTIARSMVSLKQSSFKPRKKTVVQFSGKVPPGTLRAAGNGTPPRRPPNTIAGRGTASKPPSTNATKVEKDAKYWAMGGK